jgi:hypothetical protein
LNRTDIWAANTWNAVEPVVSENPIRRTSTWGGGFGITVIYGVASPVRPPLMGQVWKYKATGVTTGYGKEKRSWNR